MVTVPLEPIDPDEAVRSRGQRVRSRSLQAQSRPVSGGCRPQWDHAPTRVITELEARYGIGLPADLTTAVETVDVIFHHVEVKDERARSDHPLHKRNGVAP